MVDIEKIEKRTVRSVYDDGLFEIALGFILLLLGGYFYAQAVAPEGSALASMLSVLFVLIVVSAGFLVGRVVHFLKRRITYPRTGYVELKKKEVSPRRRALTAVVGALIGALAAGLYNLAPSLKVLLPALNGLVFAFVVLLIAHRIGLVRIHILAAASAVIGFAITASGLGDVKGVGLYYALFGAALIVSGLAALVIYLRRSPKPAADGPEGPDAG